MHLSQGEAGQTRWIVADFSSAGQARRAADALQGQGLAARVVTPSPPEEIAGDAGLAVVRIGLPAWIGLLAGVVVGLILGILLWNGQVVIAPLAPTLSAGRTAVPTLLAGILGAFGWLIGALLPLALERPVARVIVRLPAGTPDVVAVERQLAARGAWNVRMMATAPEQSIPSGPRTD